MVSNQQPNEDEDALLSEQRSNIRDLNVPHNEYDELRMEFKRRSREACPGLDCCGNDCSFHCATSVISIYWMIRAILIIILIALYLFDVIECSNQFSMPIIEDCDKLNSVIMTIFIIQILCIFVCLLALISSWVINSVLMIPIILYSILMLILVIVGFFISLMQTLWALLDNFILIAVGLELWAFYKTCIIVKTQQKCICTMCKTHDYNYHSNKKKND